MAFNPVPKPPQFADLKGILTQSKETDNPLYQVVQELIERLTQLKLVTITEERIREVVINNIPVEVPTTPTEGLHAPTHEPGGVDPMTVDAAPTVGSLRTLGTGANQAAPGNDIRFTDPSPPLPHAATHNTGGSDPITNIAETIIADGAILARVAANETITGQWTFNQGITNFVHPTAAQVYISETSAPADNKHWRFLVISGGLSIQTVNDALTTAQNAFQFARSGNTVTAVNFFTNNTVRTIIDSVGTLNHNAGVRFSGQVNVSVGADQTAWNPTGLGINFLLVVTPTQGGLNIRGILAQPAGTLLCLYFNTALTMNFTFEDASATVTNRLTLPGGVTFTTVAYQSVTFIYDSIGGGRWRMIARS